MGSDSQDIQQHIGCGTELNLSQITLNVNTTTGGCFSVSVDSQISVENLKRIVSKKLKVAKDRICLLHREKELHDGTSLKENGIMDGSRIILLPNVETGLLAQRPENTVMQALESLNDSQVNDFLIGKTPLQLTMRYGEHVIVIQLQLTTVAQSNDTSTSPATATSSAATGAQRSRNGLIRSRTLTSHPLHTTTSSSSSTLPAAPTQEAILCEAPAKGTLADRGHKAVSIKHGTRTCGSSPEQTPTKQQVLPQQQQSTSRSKHHQPSTLGTTPGEQSDLVLSNEQYERISSLVSSLTIDELTGAGVIQKTENVDIEMGDSSFVASTSTNALLESTKSLANLVSGPIKTIPLTNIPLTSNSAEGVASACADPISANLTSCLCKRFNASSNGHAGCNTDCQLSRSQQQLQQMQKLAKTPRSSSSSLLRRTLNNPIARPYSGHHHHHHHRHAGNRNPSATCMRRSQSSDSVRMIEADNPNGHTSRDHLIEEIDTVAGGSTSENGDNPSALAEASRNLNKTFEKLSKEVTNVQSGASGSGVASTSTSANAGSNQVARNSSVAKVSSIGSGTVIESIQRHGRSYYSGTFSGTLNPALQDCHGRPKSGISTVIHILNDLLSAKPHYSRGARISFEPAQSSRSSKYSSSRRSGNSAGSTVTSGTHSHLEHCSKCISSKSGTNSDAKTLGCRRSLGSHSARHEGVPKPSSLPSTPVTSSAPSLDCHLCHMRLASSAPVTPTSTSQSISISDTSFTVDSIASSATSSPDSTSHTTSAPLNPICVKCTNIEIENSKTKTKLDQLRLVMQQRRERREARKLKVTPYGARIVGKTATTIPSTTTTITNTSVIQTTIDGPSATSALVEQVDTLA